MTTPSTDIEPAVLEPHDRKAILADEVSRRVARGGRVEVQTDYQAIIVSGRRVNHLLHLILSVLTIGAWALLIWLPLAIFGGEKRYAVTVDRFGNITTAKGRG